MNTLFASSQDGTRIAYDRSGSGLAVVLLHGGGSARGDWHESGYVERLQNSFTVITLDLRGHGESGLPTDAADYNVDKMVQDVLAVADACGVEHFTVWGMSFGSKISRYLAVQSKRVIKLILLSAQLGPGVTGQLRQDAIDFCAHWPPIVQAYRDGKLDIETLSQEDQEFWSHFNVPVMLAWVRAMLDWPVTEPADFHSPTLWLVGSEDPHAMASIKEYEESLEGSKVQVHVVEGLDHNQLFDEIDKVFSIMLAFTRSSQSNKSR
ncbi:MAG: alpha/beta fold hydrolase [Anaerolineales bacterium]|nr:alpha/beta fold hydrolase [Anaerolineales bacterium]